MLFANWVSPSDTFGFVVINLVHSARGQLKTQLDGTHFIVRLLHQCRCHILVVFRVLTYVCNGEKNQVVCNIVTILVMSCRYQKRPSDSV